MGFRKDEVSREEAPAFSDQAVADGQGLRMVGIILVEQGKVGGGINKGVPCCGGTSRPHACL